MKEFFKKIIAFFKATDKQLHILAAFSIAAVLYILVSATQPWWVGMLIGTGVSAVVCVGKEFYDKQNPKEHSFEVGDLIADGIGIAVFVLATFINLGQ